MSSRRLNTFKRMMAAFLVLVLTFTMCDFSALAEEIRDDNGEVMAEEILEEKDDEATSDIDLKTLPEATIETDDDKYEDTVGDELINTDSVSFEIEEEDIEYQEESVGVAGSGEVTIDMCDSYGHSLDSMCTGEYKYIKINKPSSSVINVYSEAPQIFITKNKPSENITLEDLKADSVMAFKLSNGELSTSAPFFTIPSDTLSKIYPWENTVGDSYDCTSTYAGVSGNYVSGQNYYVAMRVAVDGAIRTISTEEAISVYDIEKSSEDPLEHTYVPIFINAYKKMDREHKRPLEILGNEDKLEFIGSKNSNYSNTRLYLWDYSKPLYSPENIEWNTCGDNTIPYGLYPINNAERRATIVSAAIDELYPSYTNPYYIGDSAGVNLYTKNNQSQRDVTKIPAGSYRYLMFKESGKLYIGNKVTVIDGTTRGTLTASCNLVINIPDGLEGALTLKGVRADDGTEKAIWNDRWDKNNASNKITILAGSRDSDDVFTALKLYGYVGNAETLLAKKETDIDVNTASVTLDAEGVELQYVDSINVSGIEETDYSTISLYSKSSGKKINLPTLLKVGSTDYTARANLKYGTNLYFNTDIDAYEGVAAASLDPVTVTAGNTKASVNMSVIAGKKLNATRHVTGSVKQKSSKTVSGATVIATQMVGKRARSITAATDAFGNYSMDIYPDKEAEFSVIASGQNVYVSNGKTLLGGPGDVTKDIVIDVNSLILSVSINSSSQPDRDVIKKYLGAARPVVYADVVDTSTSNSIDYATIFMEDKENANKRLSPTADISGKTLKIKYKSEGGILKDGFKDITISSGGNRLLTIEPQLNAGVIGSFTSTSTTGTTPWRIVWFNESGYVGASKAVFPGTNTDIVSPCPGAAGSYTLLFVPEPNFAAVKAMNLTNAKNLYANQAVTVAEGQIVDIGSHSVGAAQVTNDAYITKPNSSMMASKDSFRTAGENTGELIAITGHIGLDDGIADGKLTTFRLRKSMFNNEGRSKAASKIEKVYINGEEKSVTDTTEKASATVAGGNVSLPCDFTVYARAVDEAHDFQITATADVAYRGGTAGNQLVGEVTVKRPGSTINTLSHIVNKNEVEVYGLAKANQKVTIYDSETEVGHATADKYGEWSAVAKLNLTDDIIETTHRVYAVTEDANKTNELTITHRAGGPQLIALTMSYSDGKNSPVKTINVGDPYNLSHAMYNNVVRATFENINEIGSFSDGSGPQFTVLTKSGKDYYIPAIKDGDSYYANVEDLKANYITRVDISYQVKQNSRIALNDDGTFTINASGSQEADALSETISRFKNVASWGAETEISANSWDEYKGLVKKGYYRTTGDASDEEIDSVINKISNSGLDLEKFEQKKDPEAITTRDWVKSLRVTPGKKSQSIGRLRVYNGRENFEASLSSLPDVKFITINNGSSRVLLGTLSDATMDENGIARDDATYNFTFQFMYDESQNVYLEQDSILLSDSYDPAALSRKYPGFRALRYELLTGAPQSLDFFDIFTNSGSAIMGLESIGQGLTAATKALTDTVGNTLGGLGIAFSLYDLGVRVAGGLEKVDNLYKLMKTPCAEYIPAEKYWPIMRRIQHFGNMVNLLNLLDAGLTAGSCFLGALAIAGGPMTVVLGSVGLAAADAWLTAYCGTLLNENYDALEADIRYEIAKIKRLTRNQCENDSNLNINDFKQQAATDGKNAKGTLDPSGIIYEAVIENPIKDATVELFYGANASNDIIKEANKENVTKMESSESVVRELYPRVSSMTTGQDGMYSWGVPEGLWYVKASADGYADGNSTEDKAATVIVASGKYLPVLPIQLNVNIPLVDTAAPYIQGVEYTSEGVILTFSKYMEDTGAASVLEAGSYSLSVDGRSVSIDSVITKEQGHVPNNRPNAGKTYSRKVLVKSAEAIAPSSIIMIDVDNSSIQSYAGSKMVAPFNGEGAFVKPAPADDGDDEDEDEDEDKYLDEMVKLSEYEYELNLATKQKIELSEIAKSKSDGKSYKISISDKKLVSVSKEGLITAKKNTGVATVTVTKGTSVYKLTINVANPKFTNKSLTVTAGDKVILGYDACKLKPTFSLPRRCKIASIDSSTGELTTYKKGTVTVTATVGTGKYARKATMKVKIKKAPKK